LIKLQTGATTDLEQRMLGLENDIAYPLGGEVKA